MARTSDSGPNRDLRKCVSLTPLQADSIFFPGPGGKSNKARIYCSSCPVKDLCLKDAIKEGWDGFVAGTTLDERKNMAAFLVGLETVELNNFDDYVPPPVGKPKVGRRVAKKKRFDPYGYLDEVREPTIEDLLVLDTILD